MVDCKKRRLVADKAIMLNGFSNTKEVVAACEAVARMENSKCTFHWRSVSLYVAGKTNFSWARLKILAKVLRIKDIEEMDEIYTYDERAGVWYGNQGGMATLSIRNINGVR